MNKQQLIHLEDSLPELVCQKVLEKCAVNGAVNITRDEVKDLNGTVLCFSLYKLCFNNYYIAQLLGDIKNYIQSSVLTCNFNNNVSVIVEESVSTTTTTPVLEGITTYYYNNRHYRVPEGFQWPIKNCSVKLLFDFWYFGHKQCVVNGVAHNIRPYKSLDLLDYGKGAAKAYCSAQRVMKELGGDTANISQMTDHEEINDLFKGLYNDLLLKLQIVCKSAKWRRIGELSYLTIYDNILKCEKESRPLHVAATNVT